MTEKESFLSRLNKSERLVHDYIKKTCEASNGRMSESMNDIGKKLDLSEATVYRAIRKITRMGIIGIVPSTGKAKSNEIIYYGEPNEEEQVKEIFNLASDLTSNIKRFEALLQQKDNQINSLEKENKLLNDQVQKLEKQLKDSSKINKELENLLDKESISLLKNLTVDDVIELDDGRKAIILSDI